MTVTGGGVLLDFDGTLTKPALDWETMKTEMALEDDTIILEYLQTAPPDRARRSKRRGSSAE